MNLGPIGEAREPSRDERVGGGDSFFVSGTEIGVLLVILIHLTQFAGALEEIVVGISRDLEVFILSAPHFHAGREGF